MKVNIAGIKKIRIGDLLLSKGKITAEQLEKAVKVHKEQGGKLGDVLKQLGFINDFNLVSTLAEQLNLPFIDLKHYPIKPDIIRRLPERIARRFRVLLIDVIESDYLVGMSDPTDLVAYDELNRVLGTKIRVAVLVEADVLRVIDLVYRRTEDIASFAEELKEELTHIETVGPAEAEVVGAEAAPVAKLLDSIFEDAVQVGASDVHIEPDENLLRIRQRVDGVLHENIVHGTQIVSAIVLRIKLMSNLNISEKRLPQDGRMLMTVKNRNLDVRVSTMPVYHGESVVMRLLDQSTGILHLNQLGMPETILNRFSTIIYKPNGMILVTGPTGSGKTTTLYAALNALNTEEKKIITIEDPVEYTLPRVNQVQINPAIGLTFASVLRSGLRQDPDIVMVGEMRDEETVQIGLRAAMTGHLVLSTLHTNDSISSVVRLMDMGAQGFLVAGSLRGIIAQRLVRKICDACSEETTLNPHEQAWFEGFLGKDKREMKFRRGKGCSRCNQSGFRGRVGVYELLEITDVLADALRQNDTMNFTHLAKAQPTFKPLSQAAFEYVADGVTTVSEIIKISSEGL